MGWSRKADGVVKNVVSQRGSYVVTGGKRTYTPDEQQREVTHLF